MIKKYLDKKYFLNFFLFAGIYFVLGYAGLKFSSLNHTISPIWFASGFAFYILLKNGLNFAPAILLGAIATNLTTGQPLWVVLLIGIGNTLEAIIACRIYSMLSEKLSDSSDYGILLKGSFAALIGVIASPTMGLLSLYFNHTLKLENIIENWITWYVGDLIGCIFILPLLSKTSKDSDFLKWNLIDIRRKLISVIYDFNYFFFFISLIGLTTFTLYIKALSIYIFLSFSGLLLISNYFSYFKKMMYLYTFIFISIMMTYWGSGLFYVGKQNDNLVYLQIFTALILFSYLVFESFKRARIFKLTAIILLMGWGLTSLTHHLVLLKTSKNDQKEFDSLLADANQRMNFRLSKYEALLFSIHGFVTAQESINQTMWNDFNSFNLNDQNLRKVISNVALVRLDSKKKMTSNALIYIDRDNKSINLSEKDFLKDSLHFYNSNFSSFGEDKIQAVFATDENKKNMDNAYIYYRFKRSTNNEGFLAIISVSINELIADISKKVAKELYFNVSSAESNFTYFESETTPCRNQSLKQKQNFSIFGSNLIINWTNSTNFSTAHDLISVFILFSGVTLTILLSMIIQSLKCLSNRASKLAEERTHNLNTLVSSIDDVIFEINNEGIILSSWISNVKILDKKASQINGKNIVDLFSNPDFIEKINSGIKFVSVTNLNYYFDFPLKPEEQLWVSVKLAQVIKNNGAPATAQTISISLRDISEKKKAEIALVSASKFAALGEMAGGIAHEINNPLTILQGHSSRLRNFSAQNFDPIKFNEIIDKIEKMILRINKIVKGLKSFSRNGDFEKPELISLSSIITDSLSLCEEKFKNNGINFNVGTVPDVQISCRPVQISQVLINLLNNSAFAIAGSPEPWIKLDFEITATDTLKVYVIDSGKGIPPEVQKKIMQPFFTTKEVGKGTGLGLSISKGIVESHNGKFYIDFAAPNTTFIMELPLPAQSDIKNKAA